jgi:type II secretory pathway pseudopilin PulG
MNRRPAPSKNRHAFTVVEMLVVIGILVVVSLGVATIFQSVGETVSRGRKLSQLNQFAARVERVMREDFEQMTRDGFLVIINKNAGYSNATNTINEVGLYRGDPNPRFRRNDEIMFFSRGDFASQRRALVPNMIARSNEAAIYYGIGQKRRADLVDPSDPDNMFFNPEPWDNNFDPVIFPQAGVSNTGFVNPNEFARDWSLLRHVTLLVNPQGPGQQVPTELFGIRSDNPARPQDRELLSDSDRQVMLQPAARSIFKALGRSSQYDVLAPNPVINRTLYDETINLGDWDPEYPLYLRTSGLVDIVTQDLASIRTELQALATQRFPSEYIVYDETFDDNNFSSIQSGGRTSDGHDYEFYQSASNPSPSNAQFLQLGQQAADGSWDESAYDLADVARIRSWMIDALPSGWDLSSNSGALFADDFYGGVRYEDIPTRLLFNENEFTNNDAGALERTFAEANQEMLGTSVFVPRCTEFIVEWSYGFINHGLDSSPLTPGHKQLEWYGLERRVDSNGDGILDTRDLIAAQKYSRRQNSEAEVDPVTGLDRLEGPPEFMITGSTALAATFADVEAACFGYSTLPSAMNPAGSAWPWPKLIRITMTLGDPSDRDVEETYQVIFELPKPE